MKNSGYLFFCCLMIGCINGGDEDKQEALRESTSTTVGDTIVADPTGWLYDANGDSLVQKGNVVDQVVDERIEGLNRRFEKQVKLDLVGERGDTVFVKIDSAKYLTQQMGSAGAFGYMAVVTYTLTDDPKKKFVHFDFQEGDHAMPGTYTRNNF